jgi:hypothetical protein
MSIPLAAARLRMVFHMCIRKDKGIHEAPVIVGLNQAIFN